MSIEAALAANTAALEKFNEQFAAMLAMGMQIVRVPVPAAPVETPPPATKAAAAPAPAPKVEAPAPKAEPAPAAKPTYAMAAKAVTDLMGKKGRDVARTVLQQFNAAKLTEIDAAKFGDVILACEKAAA